MKIGDLTVSVISDGRFRLDGGALFGQVPRVLWQERLRPDRQNRIPIGMNCVLIQSPRGNILVDTGVGTKRRDLMKERYAVTASKLMQGLRAHGLSPRDIHYVILSHLHFDHAGGSTRLDRRGQVIPTFPRARYLIQRAAWQDAVQPNERGRYAYFPDDFLPLEERGQVDLLDGDTEVIPGVWTRVTGGHAPGHQVVMLSQGGERIVFLGDLVPTNHHLSLAWIGAVDTFPEETLARKRELLAQAEREGWLVIFSHDASHQAGYLERRDGRLRLRPVRL